MPFKFKIDNHQQGRRLDKVLRGKWPNLPLGALMKYFRKRQILVNGSPANYNDKVIAGQEIQVPWDDSPVKKTITPQGPSVRVHLDIIYADSNICIINKPWNLLTQPAKRNDDSVIARIIKELGWRDNSFLPTPVHRLDRNTSGILVVALNGEALRVLNEAWRNGKVRKKYLALVSGNPKDKGTVKVALVKDTSKNMVTPVKSGGLNAETRYRTIKGNGDVALVSLELLTGRPHQARAHMAYVGNPIIGDRKYGDQKINQKWIQKGIKRPLLHARTITFDENFPAPLEYLSGRTFNAPPPDDFLSVLRERGWHIYNWGV
jgi:23S rRNA pseudouridine955/2504/2580 synthase